MHKFTIVLKFFLIVFMFLSSCSTTPNVQLAELNTSTTSYDETIHMNNCGGKTDTEQTVERSFSTNAEGGFDVGVQQMVVGVIAAKYSQYQNTSRGMRLVAPGGTNMEFIIRWKEEVHAGNVTVNGKASTYKVNIPIAVEQVSSRDLMCSGEQSIVQPTNPVPVATAMNQSAVFWSDNNKTRNDVTCPVLLINGLTGDVANSQRWKELIDSWPGAEPVTYDVTLLCSRIRNTVHVFMGNTTSSTSDIKNMGDMSLEQVQLLINSNTDRPFIIIPYPTVP